MCVIHCATWLMTQEKGKILKSSQYISVFTYSITSMTNHVVQACLASGWDWLGRGYFTLMSCVSEDKLKQLALVLV